MATIEVPEYVSVDEVQRVCAALGLDDWTQVTEASVSADDAARIRSQLGGEALQISTEEFRHGLEVELEHGVRFAESNITNNHPLLTGKIVLAHLKEMLDYYVRLRLAELEGDMFKAFVGGDREILFATYGRVMTARRELTGWELMQT
jgi:hypothetical protein